MAADGLISRFLQRWRRAPEPASPAPEMPSSNLEAWSLLFGESTARATLLPETYGKEALPAAPSLRIANADDTHAARPAQRQMEPALAPLDEGPTDVSLTVHLAEHGDTQAGANGWAGEPQGPMAIEGFSANHESPNWSRDLAYRAVLPDGSLGPVVKGGLFCGTRGDSRPLHGFVLESRENSRDLAGLTYAGIFRGGFRSQACSPGEICAAPDRAPLLAMRIAIPKPDPRMAPAEKIRMVIWDLDETFWDGTLTEGGIIWREDRAQIVRDLALRGIVSSICSKNDRNEVLRVLEQHGMRDHFVFPSIDWNPKGPRLAALIEDVQLRAPSVLFIDDNPLNRAEAAQFVPGLAVRSEAGLNELLQDPLLQGKPDPARTRLDQYRLLERRHADRATVQGDTAAFLRDSNIVVRIEYDIEPHIDRAVELINRTNQLNFTKNRLPDDADNPEAARDALRSELAQHEVQAGLVHVRDRYGDYGYCGFYIIRRAARGEPHLRHFTFSCRILGMGVETWLYRALNRPFLRPQGKVVSDPIGDDSVIDWITTAPAESEAKTTAKATLSHVLLRGACDLRALSHYFAMTTDNVVEEFDIFRRGQRPLLNHSVIAAQAVRGSVDVRAITDAALLGYDPEDFAPFLAGSMAAGPALWVFGFALDGAPLFRHKETGTIVPWVSVGLTGSVAAMLKGGAEEKVDPAVAAHLRTKFDYIEHRPTISTIFQESLHTIFSHAGEGVTIYIVLADDRFADTERKGAVVEPVRAQNAMIADIAGNFTNVALLDPRSFMTPDELAAMTERGHYDRIVYYRIFRHIAERAGL